MGKKRYNDKLGFHDYFICSNQFDRIGKFNFLWNGVDLKYVGSNEELQELKVKGGKEIQLNIGAEKDFQYSIYWIDLDLFEKNSEVDNFDLGRAILELIINSRKYVSIGISPEAIKRKTTINNKNVWVLSCRRGVVEAFPLITKSEKKTDWKTLYSLFRKLEKKYLSAHPNTDIGGYLLVDAMNPDYSINRLIEDIQGSQMDINIYDDWEDIERLREVYEKLMYSGCSIKTPAESVYQTAIQVSLLPFNGLKTIDNNQKYFYRGQRDAKWSLMPSIFRELEELSENEQKEELSNRINKLKKAFDFISKQNIGKNEFEILAIIQHYSHELDVKTWLIDVTNSPFIALFFASSGGKEGDIGVLDYIERVEWLNFSERNARQIGKINVSSPNGVLRIENQKAFFIESPNPEFYDMLSHRRLYFRQNEGEVFEDEFVKEINIYPEEDPILKVSKNFNLDERTNRQEKIELKYEPTIDNIKIPDEELLFSIVSPWINRSSKIKLEISKKLCQLHAGLIKHRHLYAYRHRHLVFRNVSTLHSLKHKIKLINAQENINNSWKNIINRIYYEDLSKTNERRIFVESLENVNPNWIDLID